MTITQRPLLEARNVVKEFPGGVVANDHVTLSVRPGEIHGLLGENGAGKSTLMKILYGLYTPDTGEIYVDGDLAAIDEPNDAIDHGIGMVHQHFMLVPRLSVAENVAISQNDASLGSLGRVLPEAVATSRYLRPFLEPFALDLSATRTNLERIMDQYDMDIDPDAKVWELDVGQKQRVEILKALYNDVDLLVLDEPTAVLSTNEAEKLFETVSKLADEGVSVILITHKLDEITEHTDRVTVLRDGSVVDTVETASVSKADLAEMMVGREVIFDIDRPPLESGGLALDAQGLRATNDRGLPALRGVDVRIDRGEIVGLAGVSGNGQLELAECLAGIRDRDDGTVRVGDDDLTDEPTRRFVESGVSYIPADRHKYGVAPELSVMHNVIMKERGQFTDGRFLDYAAATDYASRLVDEFDIKVPNVDVPAGKLSGGNLQKLILARELSREPDVVVANQPTRGLDVGAIEYVREALLAECDRGAGVLFISEDLEEVLGIADRILVINDGRVVHETTREEADRDRIGLLMTEGGSTVRSESAPDGANAERGEG